MRVFYSILLCLLGVLNSYSQSFENNPLVKNTNDKEATISSVSITGNETVVTVSVNNSKRKPLTISHNMTLTTNTGSHYKIKRFSIGLGWLELDKKYHPAKKYNIFLYFDKIPESTTSIDIEELYIDGGKYWKGIVLRKNNTPTTSQSYSSNNKKNKDMFGSSQQIRDYLASNILSLDPIEGEYDTQMGYKTNSPFMSDGSDHSNLFIIKKPNTNQFVIYSEDGQYIADNPRIESIGSTNAYRVYYGSSSNRGILENNIRLSVSIDLSPSDAKDFADNQRFRYNIIVTYDFVKKYPTGEMYANAARKYYEESTPKTWTGTGFALNGNYIVTNYHVVEGAKSIAINGVNGSFNHPYNAEVIATDKINDLALLKVNGVNIAASGIPYSVKTTTSEVGEDVFVLGYPLTSTMGDEIKLTTGVISSKTGFQGDVSIYQISAPIQPGNSGGPLFDSKGNVIGIVSAKHQGAENVGYAIKTSYLRNLMESTVSSNILPQNNKVSNLNLSGKVKSVKRYVYYIVCSSEANNNLVQSPNTTSSEKPRVTPSPPKVDKKENNQRNKNEPLKKTPPMTRKENKSNITINNPTISSKTDEKATINSVTITKDYTAVKITWNNQSENGFLTFCSVSQNTGLIVNGKKYTMTNAEGIKVNPEKTHFSRSGQEITFVLYFPPIPLSTTKMDLIDTDYWDFYGIRLK